MPAPGSRPAGGLTSDDKGKEDHGVEVAPSLTQLGVAVVGLASACTRRPPAPLQIAVSYTLAKQRCLGSFTESCGKRQHGK